MRRNFLFLQGPIGPFFKLLGDRLATAGHNVSKVNFNSGDRFFWDGENTIDFTGKISQWGSYITHVSKLRKVTDLVIYGDCRPVHKIAVEALKESGIKIHVFEEGYFRPNWITYEENGVNAHSQSIPQDPEFYRKWEEVPLPDAVRFGSSFNALAIYSVQYYLASLRGMYGEFRHYEHHFNVSPHVTIARWIPKTIFSLWNKHNAKKIQEEIVRLKYFLVPLQLCRDYQIKEHSQFRDMVDFAEHIIRSFAANADGGDSLVFKLHPLDNNQLGLQRAIDRVVKRNKIGGRVWCIDGGHLPTLMDNAKGVIVANSTTGISSIHHHRPTKALSRAVYNFEGMTDQQGLDSFWGNPQAPDMELYAKFRNYVIAKTQVNGGFYNSKGISRALDGITRKLLSEGYFDVNEMSEAGI